MVACLTKRDHGYTQLDFRHLGSTKIGDAPKTALSCWRSANVTEANQLLMKARMTFEYLEWEKVQVPADTTEVQIFSTRPTEHELPVNHGVKFCHYNTPIPEPAVMMWPAQGSNVALLVWNFTPEPRSNDSIVPRQVRLCFTLRQPSSPQSPPRHRRCSRHLPTGLLASQVSVWGQIQALPGLVQNHLHLSTTISVMCDSISRQTA